MGSRALTEGGIGGINWADPRPGSGLGVWRFRPGAGGVFRPEERGGASDAPSARGVGVTRQPTVPGQQSQTGVTPPGNETQVDHIIPKSQNGDGSPSNAQILCRTCNIEKSDKPPQ
jgi:hypothetical protein